jgi:stress response protein YsnF
MKPENKKEYAILLLQKTRLSRPQISELTEYSLSYINKLSDVYRPKSINEMNVLEGRAPDVETELLKLQKELTRLKIEETKQDTTHLSFNYEVSSLTQPSNKELTLSHLKKLKEYVEQLDSNDINLYLELNGRGL